MRYITLIIFAITLVLTGCSANEKDVANTGAKNLEPIKVNIVIHPSPIEINKEVTFEATVTQGNEKVDHAENVEFEIWRSDEENHKKIKGDPQGKGIYSIKHTFTNVGKYNVIAHVTANDLHTMPQREFEVVDLNGDSEPQSQPEANADHHHGTGLLIHFMNDEGIKANQEAELMAHISYKNTPLQGARVRFEVWMEGQEKHEYIDAFEGGDGEYSAVKNFSEQGQYNIKIHVEEETSGIHDHQLETVTVQ